LAVTSIHSGEGKSLLAISLAYSFSLTENKVLLIDGNFNNPTISHSIRPLCYLEDFFKTGATEIPLVNGEQLTVIANRGNNTTLFEIGHKKCLKERFNGLRSVYDVIIIDTPPLTALNKAKEWLSQADRTIAIFEADQGITKSQEQHVAYLHTLGRRFSGWILNGSSLPPKMKRKKRELETVINLE
jgi:Mrp family chromosome partitioning ATPase